MTESERLFPLYHNSDFIKSIADNCKWTISDKDKMPINVRALINEHKLVGAVTTDETCLMTLPELCSEIEKTTKTAPANNAYYLDALVDKWVVLDIESKCPTEVRDKLLKLPYIYGELSLSGKGIHLIFPLPDCINRYPNAMKKVVFKEEHGWYELLLCHWVTFTRKMIQPFQGDTTDQADFIEFFDKIASEQKEVVRDEINITEFENLTIPNEEEIISLLSNQRYNKRLADFHNDHSKFEFGYTSFLVHKINKLIHVSYIKQAFDDMNYSDEMLINVKAYLIYKTLMNNLEPRAKWDESRDGLPWLLYLAREGIAKTPDMTEKE